MIYIVCVLIGTSKLSESEPVSVETNQNNKKHFHKDPNAIRNLTLDFAISF